MTEYEYEIDEKPSFCAGVRLQKEDVEVPLGEVPVGSDFFPYESRNDFCRSLHYHNVIGAPSYRRIKTKKITSNGYSKKESYVYDNQDRTLKPKQIYLTNDGGDSILYIYKFPFDYSDALCSEMMSINMRDVIVDEVTKYNRNQVSEVRYSFLKTNGMILPSAIFKSVGENQASEKTRITDYDEYGNIIGFVSGSEHVAIIWGYRHSYPIAIIRGCSRSDLERRIEPHLLKSISMKSVPTDTDIELIRNAAEICHALVTIYTRVSHTLRSSCSGD